MEAELFYFRPEKNNTVCELVYAGPTRLVFEKKNSMCSSYR